MRLEKPQDVTGGCVVEGGVVVIDALKIEDLLGVEDLLVMEDLLIVDAAVLEVLDVESNEIEQTETELSLASSRRSN